MIRDPSDGTVRDVQHRPEPLKTKENAPESAVLSTGPDTGLRQPTRSDAQLRLEESRTWLKSYFAKKEREHAGADIEQKLPQTRHPIEGERPAKPATSA